MSTTPEKIVGIVDRAARILACFERATPERALPEIAAHLDLPKPTAFRILTNLVRHGLLAYDESTKVYTLGFANLRFADAVLRHLPIRAAARPTMQAIREAINETVVLSVRDRDHRINVDSAESTQAIAPTLQLGVRIPLYAGAASQVLLAGLSEADISDYLGRTALVAFSATTLIGPNAVRQRVAEVRDQGFAVSYGEFTPSGGSAIAVPLRDPSGTVIAALHISGPKGRLTPELQRRCLDALLTGSRTVTDALAKRAADRP